MPEKLLESITFKCTDSEKVKALAISKSKKFNSISEYMRDLLIRDISEVEAYLNTLIPIMGITTDTADTFHLELVPRPILDVTPKYKGTKKVQMLEQMDFLTVHSEK
ncbi:hypothetical protein [Acinetobacter radioresistens]|uniref:hypothetical protein n=1 Tax=Acinetobacter radioresistens TaxID=40216 RepID=UPI0022483E7B|nr:hypothetical protein [Acinetobacter radioresistens]MCX0334768.1 hypothetical protein [Acinetobacter radioresistens]